MTEHQNLSAELKNKKICRFCMTQEGSLTNLYSSENRLKSRAPLPLQIMACVSIEVFTNDGMPSLICDNCRLIMDYCYRFKQMCKKSETTLKQIPLTGIWPKKLELPVYPDELLRVNKKVPLYVTEAPIVVGKKRARVDNVSPDKKIKILNNECISEPIMVATSSTPHFVPAKKMKNLVIKEEPHQSKAPKILNKSSMIILNKNAPNSIAQPVLSKPIIRTNEQGNVEIITEILENNETDPIKFAPLVETDVFPCDQCERSFPLRQLLDIHMSNHNRERSFECNACSKAFYSKYDLSKHLLTHTGDKPFTCVVCNKSFSRSTLLHRHEKIHIDTPKFMCAFCDKTFLSETELEKHSERHKKSRPFPCQICGKAFAFKQGLERHETIHSKDQPHKCEHCFLSFPTPSKLARHLTAHAGRRPYPCRLCPKSYLLSHHLTRHIRSHKESDVNYTCYDCSEVFASRNELIYHSAVHATQNLICPLCQEHFDDLDDVTEHIKSHTEGEQFACEFCDLIFITEEKLDEHSNVTHQEEQAAYKDDTRTRVVATSVKTNEDQSGEDEQEELLEEFYITPDDHSEAKSKAQGGNKRVLATSVKTGLHDKKTENSPPPNKRTRRSNDATVKKIVEIIKQETEEEEDQEVSVEEEEIDDPNEEVEIEVYTQGEDFEEDEYVEIKQENKTLEKSSPKVFKGNQNLKGKEKVSPSSAKSTTTAKADVSKQPIAKQIQPKEKSPDKNVLTKVVKLPSTVTVTRTSANSNKSLVSSTKTTAAAAAKPAPVSKPNVPTKTLAKAPMKKVAGTPDVATPPLKASTQNTPIAKSFAKQEKKLAESAKQNNTTVAKQNNTKSPASKGKPITSPVTKQSPSTSEGNGVKSTTNVVKKKENSNDVVRMRIGDEMVKVQKVKMTKAQMDLMAKQGKIEIKDGQIYLKKK